MTTPGLCGCAMMAFAALVVAAAGEESQEALALDKIRAHVQPLSHPLGDRLPLLMWQGPRFPTGLHDGRVEETQQVFLDRGFLPLCNPCATPSAASAYVPILKFWQKRAVPLCILPQGWVQAAFMTDRAGRSRCAHQPPADPSEKFPCPSAMLADERVTPEAQRIRETLRLLKDNGLELRLLVIDFESGAYLRNIGDRDEAVRAQMAEALKCPRCVAAFTEVSLSTPAGYAKVVNHARAMATRRILSAPAREIYPNVLLGNFYAWPIDRVARPEGSWPAYGYEHSGLNVAMPRVYMNAGWGGAGRDQDKMNWNAFYCALEGFSPAASVLREDERLIPWIHVWLGGRYLSVVMQGRKLPEPWAMSEVARHMILRGAETFAIWMDAQIGEFPADYPHPDYAAMGQFVYDLKGVQEGFNDMLRFNAFLRRAKPMTFAVPGQRAELGPETATWSGMQTSEKALVRAVSFNRGQPVVKSVGIYDHQVALVFPACGSDYWVFPDGRVENADGP